MKISEIRNPQDFQNLCQSLLCAEFNDTQIVRDSSGDGGMDAYVPSTKTLYAMYCPKFVPAPKEYYQRKIRGDLKKAVKLRDEQGYAINCWIFLTPEPMDEKLHRYLGNKVNEAGFAEGANQSELHLQNLLLKHSHLRPQFPEFIFSDLESQLNEIQAEIRGTRGETLPEDEFSYYTLQALDAIHNTLSGLENSLPRFEIAQIEAQWRLGKPVLLFGDSGTGKSGIAATLASQAVKPVLLLDARNIAHLKDEPSLRHYFSSTAPLSQTIINLAQSKGFRLIIDQLDDLIGMESHRLLIDLAIECSKAKVVEAIVISRSQETQEARLLRAGFVEIESLKLTEEVVAAILAILGINFPKSDLVRLGQNLLLLEIICKVRQQRPEFNFTTTVSEIALWDEYLGILRAREPSTDGSDPAELLITRATELARTSLQRGIPTFVLELPIKPVESKLKRLGIIVCQEGRIYRFGHEKLQDYLYARYMCGQGSLPSAISAEIAYHRMRDILPLMEAIYATKSSIHLLPFLREVFESTEVPFFSQTAILERYIRSSNPAENPAALTVIIEVLRTKLELRRWFFFNSPHPCWAKILLEHGFFDEAPEPVATERGFLLPRWDAQDYLISIADEVPDVVLAHFEHIRTNKNYLGNAVTALCLIPMKQANQAVPKLLECLSDAATAFAIAEPSFALMKKLAQANFADSAFALFDALPDPQRSPRAKKSEAEILEDYVFDAEAISFLPTDDYEEEQLWKPGLEELAGLDLKRLVTLLEKQLIQALRIEAETRGRSDEERGYSFWRQAIEDTSQDR